MEFSIDINNLIGIIAGAITTSAFVPQVLKIYKTKTARDISLTMLVFLMIGITLWLFYGILIKELPVILANSVSLFLISLIIFMKIRYH